MIKWLGERRQRGMRFPWRRSKSPEQSSDGGRKTAIFSFSREREREIATTYSRGRSEWLEARFVLIDEVLAYRESGVLTQSLLDACDAEFEVAAWPYSEGIRRLVELVNDGHARPLVRLEQLWSSANWRVRYNAIQAGLTYLRDPDLRCSLLRRALVDRSARIRSRMSADATCLHMIDMADEIEAIALAEADDKVATSMFFCVSHLRYNEAVGRRGAIGGQGPTTEECDAAFARLRSERGMLI